MFTKYLTNFFIIITLYFLQWNEVKAVRYRKLISAQVISRHGERAPLLTYPNDPHKDYDWGVPLGTLTKNGIKQEELLGKTLRKRYMYKYKLLSKDYDALEVEIRSTKKNRTIESALAFLRGFYQLEDSSSIPILTDFFNIPKPWNGCNSCPKYKWLLDGNQPKYEKQIFEDNKKFLEKVAKKAGYSTVVLRDITQLYDVINVQVKLGLKMPSWLTLEEFYQLRHVTYEVYKMLDGMPFSIFSGDPMLRKVIEGPLLRNILNNFEAKKILQDKKILDESLQKSILYKYINTYTKFVAYSAHDYTLGNILAILGIGNYYDNDKDFVVDFTGAIFFELYQNTKNQYEIKILFSKKGGKNIRDITDRVHGCKKSKNCLFKNFSKAMQSRIPKNTLIECFLFQTKSKQE